MRLRRQKILDYQDSSAYDLSREDENLILYTCYPFDAAALPRTALCMHGISPAPADRKQLRGDCLKK